MKTDNECRIPAVEAPILTIRGRKVILDADLARMSLFACSPKPEGRIMVKESRTRYIEKRKRVE